MMSRRKVRKVVRVWATTDNKTFETKADAGDHQAYLDIALEWYEALNTFERQSWHHLDKQEWDLLTRQLAFHLAAFGEVSGEDRDL